MTDPDDRHQAERYVRDAWLNTLLACAVILVRVVWAAQRWHPRPGFAVPYLVDVVVTLALGLTMLRRSSRIAAGLLTARAVIGTAVLFARGWGVIGVFGIALSIMFARGWYGTVLMHRVRAA